MKAYHLSTQRKMLQHKVSYSTKTSFGAAHTQSCCLELTAHPCNRYSQSGPKHSKAAPSIQDASSVKVSPDGNSTVPTPHSHVKQNCTHPKAEIKIWMRFMFANVACLRLMQVEQQK